MSNFDIVELRERVRAAAVPAIQLAVGSAAEVRSSDKTLFGDGAVEDGVVELLVAPEGFSTQKTPRGLTAEVGFWIALRTNSETTAWKAASGLYSLGKREGITSVNVSFITPDDAEEPEFIVDARLGVVP